MKFKSLSHMRKVNLRLAPVFKSIFINMSYHMRVASLTLMGLF